MSRFESLVGAWMGFCFGLEAPRLCVLRRSPIYRLRNVAARLLHLDRPREIGQTCDRYRNWRLTLPRALSTKLVIAVILEDPFCRRGQRRAVPVDV